MPDVNIAARPEPRVYFDMDLGIARALARMISKNPRTEEASSGDLRAMEVARLEVELAIARANLAAL